MECHVLPYVTLFCGESLPFLALFSALDISIAQGGAVDFHETLTCMLKNYTKCVPTY